MKPNISEAMIESLVDPAIVERGWRYYERGNVLSIAQRGAILVAQVQGSDEEPYRVQITLTTRGIGAVGCSCPYMEEWDGVCKHVVAVLLTYVHTPDQIAQRQPIADLIADLDAVQLRKILITIATQQPDVADLIEQAIK